VAPLQVVIPRITNRLPRPHLSFSQITAYERCGLAYKYRNIDGLTGAPSWAMLGGSAVHSAVEILLTSSELPNWERHWADVVQDQTHLTNVRMDDWTASGRGREGFTWWLVEGGVMLKHLHELYAQRFARGWTLGSGVEGDKTPCPVEWTIDFEIVGSTMMRTIIDSVWRKPDGTIYIEDLKTGRSAGNTLQLVIEASAVKRHVRKPVKAGFLYARGLREVEVDSGTSLEYSKFLYRAEMVNRGVRAGAFPASPSFSCKSCEFYSRCPMRG
jgi:hypothetical protein